MLEKIKLLLVEDNASLAESLATYLQKQSQVEVVGTASNAAEALEFIKITHPDALITDIIMPETDGFMLLEKLAGGEYGPMPKTMVLSALGQEPFVQRAFNLGAEYYMLKPFDPATLYDRLLDIFNMRSPVTLPTPAVKSRSLDEQITSIFLTIGIPAHIKGYQFLREGIKMVIKNPDIINNITKQLYPGIAVHFDTSASKIERAIRHAIEVAWTRGKIDNVNAIFGYNIYSKNDKPTNGEFIALIADRLLISRIS